jgi:hypothetical protein
MNSEKSKTNSHEYLLSSHKKTQPKLGFYSIMRLLT